MYCSYSHTIMLHAGNGADPMLTQDGLHFNYVAVTVPGDAIALMDTYFNESRGRQSITGYGFGEAVNYRVLDDMGGITQLAGVIYIGLVKHAMHWLTTEQGLPLHFTNNVNQIIKRFHFEQNVPMHTPAMGVPRTARQVSFTDITQLKSYTQSFIVEGELYASRFDSIEVIAGLAASANGIAEYNAREAYGAILFGKSASPTGYNMANTEHALIERAMDEASLIAILHKRKNGFNYLARRAHSVMQSNPSRATPNVAIMPYGKMAAITSGNEHTQLWSAGEIGPKRVKNGIISDINRGLVTDGDSTPLVIGGVEVREAPIVRHFDTTAEEISRRIYTGDFYEFSAPPNAHFGSDPDVLPWAEGTSVEKDAEQRVHFEHLFHACGFFEEVPGIDGNDVIKQHSDDINKRLWRINTARWNSIAESMLPQEGNDADPFVYKRGNNILVRDWCEPEAHKYTSDIPVVWKLGEINKEDVEIAAMTSLEPWGGHIDIYNFDRSYGWPLTKWTVESTRRRNALYVDWNYNISTMPAGAAQINFRPERVGNIPEHVHGRIANMPAFEALVGQGKFTPNLRPFFEDYLIRRNAIDNAPAPPGRAAAHPGAAADPDLELPGRSGVMARANYVMPDGNPATLIGVADYDNDRVEARALRDAELDAIAAFNMGYCIPYMSKPDRRRQPAVPNSKIIGQTMAWWAKQIDFLMLCPYRESLMQDVAFIKSGSELGKTFMSQPRIMTEHNAMQDFWLWKVQYRSAAVVINSDNVTVFRNAVCDGMGTGNNLDLQTAEQATSLKDDGFVMNNGFPSVVCIPMPKRGINVNAGQRTSPWFDSSRPVLALAGTIPIAGGAASEPHYPGFKTACELYGWNQTRISQMTGGSNLPVAPLLFRANLKWPTTSGMSDEISHSVFGKATVGSKEVRMWGRGVNPTAV